jgi:squalene-associated FAD-dependent desaturase
VEDLADRLARESAPRVAVIGAGYAGMAAAVALIDGGARVTVFEAAPAPGGRARRVSLHGQALDNGQHILVGAYRELLALMLRVGSDPDQALLRMPLELRYASGFRLRAPRWRAPLHLVGALAGARGLPWGERLRALRFMHAMRRAGFRLSTDETVSALLARHAQNGVAAHYLWGPLCVAALNTLPQQASANAFLAVLRDSLGGTRAASDLLLPRVDLSRLFPEPAARYIAARGGRILSGHRVRDLRREGESFRVEGERFGRVVIACAPHQLAPLAASLPGLAPLAGAASRFVYQPIYTCYLQYPQTVRLPAPMLGLSGAPVQWAFDRGILCGERGRVACVISAQGAHEQLARDELAARCHRELTQALGGLPAPLWSRVIAEKRATVATLPGRARLGPGTAVDGLFLAGDYTDGEYPPTLEAAVRSGLRAAAAALRRD